MKSSLALQFYVREGNEGPIVGGGTLSKEGSKFLVAAFDGDPRSGSISKINILGTYKTYSSAFKRYEKCRDQAYDFSEPWGLEVTETQKIFGEID